MRRFVVALAIVASACGADTAATTSTPPPPDSTTSTTTTTISRPTTTSTPDSIVPTTPPNRAGSGASIAGSFDGTVGYVGCSMSQNSVEGYQMVGGADMWSFRAPYGGGTIGRWTVNLTGERGNYWGGFDKELDLNPNTTVLWWNLCTAKVNPQDSFENAVAILDEIEARIPGVTVYVSAQPTYTDGHVCALAGEGGPEKMEQVAEELIDAGLVLEGPVMGPLQKSETRDGCHANDQGKTVLGRQLLDFFG